MSLPEIPCKSPADLLDKLAFGILGYPTRNMQQKPGQLISDLPEEQREMLRNLKSDDLNVLRPDAIPIYIMVHNESYARRNGRMYDYTGKLVVKLNLK